MSGKIDSIEEDRISFRNRPRTLTEGPLIISQGPNGEEIRQRINPEWTSYMNRCRYHPIQLKEGPFSFDIDESGEPVPAPLFPDRFHPLSYCYRLQFDKDEWEPSVYCIGIPKDDEVVIFSDLLPDRTWGQLKEESFSLRDLNRRFPLMHYTLHQREKREPDKVIQEYNEEIKRKELKMEKEMLTKLIEEDTSIMQDDDPVEPSMVIEKSNKANRGNTLPRRLDKSLKANQSLSIRSCNTPRSYDTKTSKGAASRKKKAAKKERDFTAEERLYFEIHGCSYEQFIDRKQKYIKERYGLKDIPTTL